MRQILVLTGLYLPKPSANGACLDELLKEFGKRGFYSHVVSFAPGAVEYETNYCTVYPAGSDVNGNQGSNRLFSKFERLINYPLERRSTLNAAYNKALEILKHFNIELVLCNQFPESSGYIACQLKEVNPSLKIVLYELDSLTDNSHNSIGVKRFFSYRNTRLEKKIYDKTDLIIHLKSHATFYEQEKYDIYRSKSVCVDFPLISEETYSISKKVVPGETFNLIYSGVLMHDFRSPAYLLRLVSELQNRGMRFNLDFFSRGDCEDNLKKLEEGEMNGIIRANGYIAKEILDAKTASADVLVSIGNNFKGEIAAVPSKPIYYMSLGKPILHIAPDHTDMALPYLERYPGSHIVYETDDFETNVRKLELFLKSLDGNLIPFEQITSEFKENTGKNTVDKIIEIL